MLNKLIDDIYNEFGFIEGKILVESLKVKENEQYYRENIYYEVNRDIKLAKILILKLKIYGYETDDINYIDILNQVRLIRRRLSKENINFQLNNLRRLREKRNYYGKNRNLFIEIEVANQTVRCTMGAIIPCDI